MFKKINNILFILIIVIVVCFLLDAKNGIDQILNVDFSNWQTQFPNDGKIIYKNNEDPSFTGDGIRYKIIKYSNNSPWESLDYNILKDTEIEEKYEDYLIQLSAPSSVKPAFSSRYYWLEEIKNDNSLIIINVVDTHTVYILEYFQ